MQIIEGVNLHQMQIIGGVNLHEMQIIEETVRLVTPVGVLSA